MAPTMDGQTSPGWALVIGTVTASAAAPSANALTGIRMAEAATANRASGGKV